jgi:MFS family permease
MFEGLDMHLYTLAAVLFVTEFIGRLTSSEPAVKINVGWIQAAFLFGWALGGAIFGIIGDRLGCSRTLWLMTLTDRLFSGLDYFAQL